MFLIVWLMREDFMWAATGAFVMFVIAGLTDWLDGYVARKQGIVSNFGILMDALTDKILMLGLMIALVDIGQVHIFLVLLILGREFMITGMRLVAATKGVVVSAESSGKQKTVTQILAVGAFLLEAVFRKAVGADIYKFRVRKRGHERERGAVHGQGQSAGCGRRVAMGKASTGDARRLWLRGCTLYRGSS